MNIKNFTEKVLRYFGNDANPTLIAAGIAFAKGIFRPLFTMMDKKQDVKTKRYAATREGLTEVIAIGIYTLSGILSASIAKTLTCAKENLSKKDYTVSVLKDILNSKNIPANVSADKVLSIAKTFFKFKSTVSMTGVFLSAFLIIPAVCSVAMKPIMNVISKKQQTNSTQINQTKTSIFNPINKKTNFKGLNNIQKACPITLKNHLEVGNLW